MAKKERESGESHGNRGSKQKGSLIVGLGVIFALVIVMLYIEEDDFLFDRTIEENLAIYFSGVEEVGHRTMGRDKIGDAVYDENNIYGTHFFDMGQHEYYVYVYDLEVESGLTEYVRDYVEGDYERTLYRMDIGQMEEVDIPAAYKGGQGVYLLNRLNRDYTIIVNYFDQGEVWKSTWEWDIEGR